MKTWLFALVQSIIAAMGIVAYFWADNVSLATTAVLLAAIVGIAQPLLAAHKDHKLTSYHQRQWDRSIDTVDDQLKTLLADVIEPPLPHRASVSLVLNKHVGERAGKLMNNYDAVVTAIGQRSDQSPRQAERFAQQITTSAIGDYLRGLAVLGAGHPDLACKHFESARDAQSQWILPWLGWATALYQQGRYDQLRTQHPHITGVELLPYGAGDENTFLELTNSERDELTELFQQVAVSLGSYYTIAEFCVAKKDIAASHEEYRKVA